MNDSPLYRVMAFLVIAAIIVGALNGISETETRYATADRSSRQAITDVQDAMRYPFADGGLGR